MEVIAIIGAGGKTTLMHLLKLYYKGLGKRVLMTTTTNMGIEPGMVLMQEGADGSDIPDKVKECIDRYGFCMAGMAIEGKNSKFRGLPEDIYRSCCGYADVVLAEADGSKHITAKYPADYEPVIPYNTTKIIIIMGLESIGRKVSETVQRYQLACTAMGIREDDIVTEEMLDRLVIEGYLKRLEKECPGIPAEVFYAESTQGFRSYHRREF